MKLQPEQRDRFYNIFMQFFGFSIYYLTERGLLMVPDFDDSHVKWKDARVIFDIIWGEGGHLEVIDAFVDHPRTPLNRSDKDVVLGWREGIYGRFTACRQGRDVVFLYGDYAFCVCGITDEIDDGTPVFPRFINTVIVPFDGIITYLHYFSSKGIVAPDGYDLGILMAKGVQMARNQGLLIRSARQFEQVAADARDAHKRSKENGAGAAEERATHVDDEHVGVHRGALAGLSWEERTRRVDEAMKAEIDRDGTSNVLALIAIECLNGVPQDREFDAIGAYGIVKLRQVAKRHGIEGNLTLLELIEFFLDKYPSDPDKMLERLRLSGINVLKSIRLMVEAKGRLYVKADGTMKAEDIPRPVFPWISYFRATGGYVAASPREIICALEGTDWDAELARAERLDEALVWLSVAVDMRGVIEVGEALEALVERYPDVDIDEVDEAVWQRSRNSLINIVYDTIDGREYLVSANFYDDSRAKLPADQQVREILSAREGIEPYWPDEDEARLGDYATSLGRPEVRAFLQYVDEHVPDGEQDLVFANGVWAAFTVVVKLRGLDSAITSFANVFTKSKAQAQRFSELLRPAAQTLPLPVLNGNSYKRYYTEVAPDEKPSDFNG